MDRVEERLGVRFRNKELLEKALTHRSYPNEDRSVRRHNERLEFLGDAVLELVVSEYLFEAFPDQEEGKLTELRSTLVNATTLAIVAEALGLEPFLRLSRGQARDNGRAKKFLLANAFEAIIGAIYRDRGYETVRDFVKRVLIPYFTVLRGGTYQRDPKSLFQEEAQARVRATPRYELLKEEGPDHARAFEMAVYLGEELVARGKGFSKKEAEVNAAQEALRVKGWGT